MNKNRIFAFFILIALLLTCVGVSFASNDFDGSYVNDASVDDSLDIDDSDLEDLMVDDDSDIDDDDYMDDEDIDDDSDDEYLDDEDWDEDSDDEYLDDDDSDDDYLDDEDWDEDSDDDYLDDEDWDDEDWDEDSDDDYLDDEDWDDEDWDDDSDDEYLDDEDWDDEDWDEDSDDDYLDDEDWDDEDWDDDFIDFEDDEYWYDDLDWNDNWTEEGNFTEDGVIYHYHILAYKTGKAIGCAFAASNDQTEKTTAKDSSDESIPDSEDNDKASQEVSSNAIAGENTAIEDSSSNNHNSVLKSIDLGNLKDSVANTDTQNTSKVNKINNETAVPAANNSEYGLFALLLSLLVSLVVII